jgi:hypothetical protein
MDQAAAEHRFVIRPAAVAQAVLETIDSVILDLSPVGRPNFRPTTYVDEHARG